MRWVLAVILSYWAAAFVAEDPLTRFWLWLTLLLGYALAHRLTRHMRS